MRISKKVREEAALICAVCASGPDETSDEHPWPRPLTNRAANAILASDAAYNLALDARLFVSRFFNLSTYTRESDAEAEALLRTGWEPT